MLIQPAKLAITLIASTERRIQRTAVQKQKSILHHALALDMLDTLARVDDSVCWRGQRTFRGIELFLPTAGCIPWS